MRRAFCYLLLSLLLCGAPGVYAAQKPVEILRHTTASLLNAIDNNRAQIRKNPNKLEQLIRRIVLPHIDLEVVSRSVIGRKHWLNASNQARQAFKHQFVGYVVRTYSSAFSAYDNQKVKFYPIRGDASKQDRVVVQSQVVQDKGKPISVNYRMLNRNGNWKVYDISVDGVSMVRSYRAQFSELLDQHGLSGLTQRLKEKQQ